MQCSSWPWRPSTAVAGGRIAARRLLWPAAAGLLGIALLMPSLVVQLEITRGMAEKPANFGMGFDQGLVATIVPFPLSRAKASCSYRPIATRNSKTRLLRRYDPRGWWLCCAWGAFGLSVQRPLVGRQPLGHCGGGFAMVGIGSAGLLWTLMGRLPVLRAVNHHPHRLLPFFMFFALIIGGRFIERLLRRAASRKWEYAIAAATAGLMLYHVSLARDSFWCYGDRPYPQLPQEIAERVLPGENCSKPVASYGSGRGDRADLDTRGCCRTVCRRPTGRVPSAATIRSSRTGRKRRNCRRTSTMTPIEAARAYGIRWILVANPDHYWPDAITGNRSANATGASIIWIRTRPAAWIGSHGQLSSACNEKKLRLYELSGTSRMAFDRNKPSDPLPIRFRGWGAEVDCAGGGERSIIVNMAMRPWVQAAAAGGFLPASADNWGRVEVRVPDGVTRLEVFYQLPWRRGMLTGGCLMAATLVGVFLVRWNEGRRPTAIAAVPENSTDTALDSEKD